MLRSLHMKLVLIMVLLVVSLMTIAGAFLVNSVNRFYLNEFYSQMVEVFNNDPELVRDLTTATEEETDGAQALNQVLKTYMGALGVDGRNRDYYILDGETGEYLAGSNEQEGQSLEMTPNLLTALTQKEEGSKSDLTASYMDLAIPIERGGEEYIIYILDQRVSVQELNNQIFQLIIKFQCVQMSLFWKSGCKADCRISCKSTQFQNPSGPGHLHEHPHKLFLRCAHPRSLQSCIRK